MNKKILVLTIASIFGLLSLRLVHLQIAQNEKFSQLAIENAAKTVPEPAPRGVIYDRYDNVLVENQPIFSVHVLPYILFNKSKEERNEILDRLGNLLGEKVEFKVSATEPIIVKDKIPLETAIRVEEKRSELDGVVVRSQPIRLYPYGNLASHVLGYVGEIEARELAKLREQGYKLRDFIGKDGVEKKYDKQLRGIDGGKKIEVDVYGTPLRILESLDSIPGSDMKLTLDIKLQAAVEEALGYWEGAVVVMDVKTGEILALASHPNYDPNIFVKPMEKWQWKRIESKRHPFMNRALAIYPPGSIFKIITLTAALEEDLTWPEEIFNCRGYQRVSNRTAKCWLKGGHGPISVMEGLVWSCDVVFYTLGSRLGPDLIAKYARKFGLGSYTGIDLPQERKGLIPSTEWKRKRLKEAWYEGDSFNYGIGQGFVQVTPLQMAAFYGGIATGEILKPYVVAEIKDRRGKLIHQGKKKIAGNVPVSPENLGLIRKALRDVVKRGTGVAARVQGIPAAGKTGTAENPGKAHAWFISYAPHDDPEIVIASFVAHGEHGDQASAYVARDILKWYKEWRLKKFYSEEKFELQSILRGNVKVPYRTRTKPKPISSQEVKSD